MLKHVIHVALLWATVQGFCATELDCQLNGACTNGQCICDKGWKGEWCHRVNEGISTVVYPKTSDTASWGASIAGEHNGEWHGFFNVVCQQETCAHTKRAMIAHGTSPTPNGRFTFKDVAIPPELENVHAVHDTAASKWLLFYFDHLKPMPPTNCTGGSTDAEVTVTGSNPGRLGVASAPSPDGPWSTAHPVINGPTTNGYGINPSAMRLANGSYLLAYRYNPDTTGNMTEALALAISDHYEGPYSVVNGNLTGGPFGVGGRAGTAEDPFLWATPRGYHILYHQYNGSVGGPACDYDNGRCDFPGAHAYSPDLVTWHRSPYPAYTTTVNMSGTATEYNFRERPGIIFGADGSPQYLVTGVETGLKSGPPCRSVSVASELL